ncbi:MAG: serine/threonine protein kinase [Proteobacteria bacterium]|nr:serine/threonine protein kinase [Pseudomonadota bacterium]
MTSDTTTTRSEGTAANPLWAALEGSVVELEKLLARTGQGATGTGFFLALLVSVFASPGIGIGCMIIAAVSFGWFTLVHYFLVRGQHIKTLRIISPLWEVSLASMVLLVLVWTEGPVYSLGSWVPPELFVIFVAASILRLQKSLPALLGVLAAAQYGTIYLLVIYPALENPSLLHDPRMQLVRICSLVLGGLACSAAVAGLRRILGQASREMRASELFGKYHMEDMIAQGGMGEVWKAVYWPEGGFQRPVAIKVIHHNLAEHPGFVDRFRYEAELNAWLGHPNIVAALDFGRVGKTYFLAMEYVDGATLRAIANHQQDTASPLHARLVVYIGREVAAGLHYAHKVARDAEGQLMRVIHRDVSPGNILVDRSGQVKITDFGVASVLRGTESAHTDLLVGKPSYMSPEQIEEGTVDERTDLYGLGVVLWELLANRRLFLRESNEKTLKAVLLEPVTPISAIRTDLGPHWDEFFGRALARNPDERFATATEMIDALTAFKLLEGAAQPEQIGELIAGIVDVPELELDPTTAVPLQGMGD